MLYEIRRKGLSKARQATYLALDLEERDALEEAGRQCDDIILH
jgi:hypothetical protein